MSSVEWQHQRRLWVAGAVCRWRNGCRKKVLGSMWIYCALNIDWTASVFWLWQRPTCVDLPWASLCWETSRGWPSLSAGSRDKTRASWRSSVSSFPAFSLLGPQCIRWGVSGTLTELQGGLTQETAFVAGACCGRGEEIHVDPVQERRSVPHTSTAGVDST